ncbi:MAG: tetratricopeptide repeat protein, partial [Verrucomicrobia bacterium]|nr:tetratricopeptide repeat protein [Verrucomicrobiota bacterium]
MSRKKARRNKKDLPVEKPVKVSPPWQKWLPIMIIGLAGLLVYANSFQGPFVFDDNEAIRDNQTIRNLASIGRVLFPETGAIAKGVTVEGRPLLNLSFAINHAMGGTEVWGYHAGNLLIHVLAGLTLYGIVRRTLLRVLSPERQNSAPWLSLAVALLWVVHPLQTESVTYMVQRAESLVGLLYLLTLYCFIRGADGARGWLAGAVALCALGMTAKEVMATAPLVVLFYDWVFVSGSIRQIWRERGVFYLALFSTWVLLATILLGTGGSNLDILKKMFSAEGAPSSAKDIISGMSWWEYAQTQFGTVLHYLRLCVWPRPLVFDYGTEAVQGFWDIVPAALLVLLLFAATVYGVWRRHWAGFAGAFFFLILAPTTSVVPTNQTTAEHRMYLPLAAVLSLLVAGGYAAWCKLQEKIARDGKLPAATAWIPPALLVALIALGLGVQTFWRNRDYQSEYVIWQDTVQKKPANARAHNNLAFFTLMQKGQVEEAIAHYQKALELKPDYADAHKNLSVTYLQYGQVDEAIFHARKVLEIKPDYAAAHYDLGNALMQKNQVDEAIDHYEQALEIKPDYAEACYNLGNALFQKGEVDKAIAIFQKALELKPHYPEALNNLGASFLQKGQIDQAILHFQKAREIAPDLPDASYNLGNAYLQKGRVNESIAQFQEALELKPDYVLAHLNLGNVLLQAGRVDEAMVHYELAIKFNPAELGALNNLAWIMATSPESSRRNGTRALALAQQ